MIVFNLSCTGGHRFEGWFASSGEFTTQRERGLLTCPVCGSEEITKAPMAPSIPAKGNRRANRPVPQDTATPVCNAETAPEVVRAMTALAKAQAKALEHSTWVGNKFAEKSRAIHYGEADPAMIHGHATLKEANDLADEGIAVAPLPFPVAPPEDLN